MVQSAESLDLPHDSCQLVALSYHNLFHCVVSAVELVPGLKEDTLTLLDFDDLA
jgi:hypothetical protein